MSHSSIKLDSMYKQREKTLAQRTTGWLTTVRSHLCRAMSLIAGHWMNSSFIKASVTMGFLDELVECALDESFILHSDAGR